jgi:hypothetical protein
MFQEFLHLTYIANTVLEFWLLNRYCILSICWSEQILLPPGIAITNFIFHVFGRYFFGFGHFILANSVFGRYFIQFLLYVLAYYDINTIATKLPYLWQHMLVMPSQCNQYIFTTLAHLTLVDIVVM